MKKQIRKGTFETNSSSVHSITLCEIDKYTQWVNGELYLDKWSGDFITIQEFEEGLSEYIKENRVDMETDEYFEDNELREEYISEYGYITYENWKCFEFETEFTEFTTTHGDTVVALCYYGRD